MYFSSYFSGEPNQVTDSIYIGAVEHSKNKNSLEKLRITHIVCAGSWLQCYYPDDYKYLKLEVDDSEDSNISQYFNEAFEFIDNAINENGKVLIHCAAGISRSATITISYLMKKNELSYKEAFEKVKAAREIICPNEGFEKQLYEWESKLEQAKSN